MKYYFITYQANSRVGTTYQPHSWNDCISISPMEFIHKIQKTEEEGGNNWFNFIITFAMEITEEEYLKFNPHFG